MTVTHSRKKNVLGKIIIPRLLLTIHYIICELEEMEREETFRLKRVKQKKENVKVSAEVLKDTVDVKEEKVPPPKKEPTGQSIQPKAEPIATETPPVPVPVAEMGDLAVILPPGDIADPGDIFIPPRGYMLAPINEIEELMDEETNRAILDDNNVEDTVKLGESFETGEWFETPSEGYEKTRAMQEKDHVLDLSLLDSKIDELSGTGAEEPLVIEASDTKDSDDINKTESIETKQEYDDTVTSDSEKIDASVSSLENPTIKFRETAEALSMSSVEDTIEIRDTLESEQVEQDLFQLDLTEIEKDKAAVSILKEIPSYNESEIVELTEADIADHVVSKAEDIPSSPEQKLVEDEIEIQKEVMNEVPKIETEALEGETAKGEEKEQIDNLKPMLLQYEPVEIAVIKKDINEQVITEKVELVTPNAEEIKDDENKHQKDDDEVETKEKIPEEMRKESKSEKENGIPKEMTNRPLRILSSDEILEQERQRNMQSDTEDANEDKPPEK